MIWHKNKRVSNSRKIETTPTRAMKGLVLITMIFISMVGLSDSAVMWNPIAMVRIQITLLTFNVEYVKCI